MEEIVTVEEEKLIDLVCSKKYEKDTTFGIVLMARKLNITDKTIAFLKKNPNASSEEVIDYLDTFI